MLEFLAVGIGGFLGSCLRFLIVKVAGIYNCDFPFATLISNVLAGIAIGAIIAFEQSNGALAPKTKLFLTTGLLGGLSTFSTFSIETINLFSSSKYLMATGNILLNLGLSLLGVVFGMLCIRLVLK